MGSKTNEVEREKKWSVRSFVELSDDEWELWSVAVPSDGRIGDSGNIPDNRLLGSRKREGRDKRG